MAIDVISTLTLIALTIFAETMGVKGSFQFETITNVLVYSF